jgi:hypothetical protein
LLLTNNHIFSFPSCQDEEEAIEEDVEIVEEVEEVAEDEIVEEYEEDEFGDDAWYWDEVPAGYDDDWFEDEYWVRFSLKRIIVDIFGTVMVSHCLIYASHVNGCFYYRRRIMIGTACGVNMRKFVLHRQKKKE